MFSVWKKKLQNATSILRKLYTVRRTTFKKSFRCNIYEIRNTFPGGYLDFFAISLKARGIQNRGILWEWEYSRALEKYTWYRATRCGVNPKSNRCAVRFRARARYMQRGYQSNLKSWCSRTKDARDEQDGRDRKNQVGKLTENKNGRSGRVRVQKLEAVDSLWERRISMRLQWWEGEGRAREVRQKSSQVKRHDGNARLLRRSTLKVPFTYHAKTRRRRRRGEKRCGRDLQDAGVGSGTTRGGNHDNRGSGREKSGGREE